MLFFCIGNSVVFQKVCLRGFCLRSDSAKLIEIL